MFVLLLVRLIMYINLQLSDDQCNELLSRLAYKIETVTLYYHKDIDPHGKYKELDGNEWRVVYKGEKPQELCKEKPFLDECRKYLYHNVVQEIVSNCFFNMILQYN